MTTITPTRFGLKYAPIPTLALEYEEHLDVVEDDSGTRSLYVYKETTTKPSPKMIRKKLHVVELPHLTGHSEPQTIAQQLQKDNQRFLGPSVVKEQQLRRLLQQLVDRLQGSDCASGGAPCMADGRSVNPPDLDRGEDDNDDLAPSAMDEPIVEASASVGASQTGNESRDQEAGMRTETRQRDGFITQEDADDEDDGQASDRDEEPKMVQTSTRAAPAQEDLVEDEKKKKALKSESDGSENGDDDDVQSEELEYFSEDGSDEDSF